jgi:C4-dicarboxylate-specific signal transduction histidine kinase
MSREIRRLRMALRDLVALSTIPAAWVGREPATIAAGLADVLVGTLHLDFAFVRLRDPHSGEAVDVMRGDVWKGFPEWLEARLATAQKFSRKEIIPNIGNRTQQCRGLVTPIGVDAAGGLVAVACDHPDFPTETEQLLVSVAANEATTAFQNAYLVHERRRAEDALRRVRDELEMKVTERTAELHRMSAELAHVTRLTTLGELTASIAHEISQPLAAIGANGAASLNWLARPRPNLAQVREALNDIVTDAHRAANVMHRIRQLVTKNDPQMGRLNVNDVIDNAVALVRSEVQRHRASLRLALASELPLTLGDRVQLQQVIINLVMNGVEAMAAVDDRPRELVIRSNAHATDEVLVAVQDSGVGLDPRHMNQLFEAFFTTKSSGMGIGLSISRSIIEGHGGRLWATPNPRHGATFQIALPTMN